MGWLPTGPFDAGRIEACGLERGCTLTLGLTRFAPLAGKRPAIRWKRQKEAHRLSGALSIEGPSIVLLQFVIEPLLYGRV